MTTTISSAERESITAKVAEYMDIERSRMAAEILACVAEDYGYAMSLLIACDAQAQAKANAARRRRSAQAQRFGEVAE